MLISSSRIFRF